MFQCTYHVLCFSVHTMYIVLNSITYISLIWITWWGVDLYPVLLQFSGKNTFPCKVNPIQHISSNSLFEFSTLKWETLDTWGVVTPWAKHCDMSSLAQKDVGVNILSECCHICHICHPIFVICAIWDPPVQWVKIFSMIYKDRYLMNFLVHLKLTKCPIHNEWCPL